MADTERTRAAVLALLADNVTGQISAQDLRDAIVTMMPNEHMYAVDFWHEPLPEYLTTDKTARGFIEYSQVAGEGISALAAIYKNLSGVWKKALVSTATERPALGIALNTYASNDDSMQILRRGLVLNTAWSVRWSNYIGQPVYLASHGSHGSMSITATTIKQILGIYEDHGILRFEPNWAIA